MIVGLFWPKISQLHNTFMVSWQYWWEYNHVQKCIQSGQKRFWYRILKFVFNFPRPLLILLICLAFIKWQVNPHVMHQRKNGVWHAMQLILHLNELRNSTKHKMPLCLIFSYTHTAACYIAFQMKNTYSMTLSLHWSKK